MIILISVFHWYGKRMALVRQPPSPPGGSSVDDLTHSTTPRPRGSRTRQHTRVCISHTFRSISTCHNSGAIVTTCGSSITNTRQPGSSAGTGPGLRPESGSQSRVNPASLSQSQTP